MSDKSVFPDKEVQDYLKSRHAATNERYGPVAKIECIHCGQPFDPMSATASHLGLCNHCFDNRTTLSLALSRSAG